MLAENRTGVARAGSSGDSDPGWSAWRSTSLRQIPSRRSKPFRGGTGMTSQHRAFLQYGERLAYQSNEVPVRPKCSCGPISRGQDRAFSCQSWRRASTPAGHPHGHKKQPSTNRARQQHIMGARLSLQWCHWLWVKHDTQFRRTTTAREGEGRRLGSLSEWQAVWGLPQRIARPQPTIAHGGG
jgi:hypothetical protein